MKLFLTAILFLVSTNIYLNFAQAAVPSPQVPQIYLKFWNGDSGILSDNNCYNYSTNRVTNSFAQPGEASGSIYENVTCEDVSAAAATDLGIESTAYFPYKDKTDDTLIALVVAPGYDFHWYRRDSDGFWSHKPGSSEARNTDESKQPITSPETADRGDYIDFCGYFHVKNYLTTSNEQNGGFVRIGSMTALPDKPDQPSVQLEQRHTEGSDIEVLKYSGRRNPRIPLSKALANPDFSQFLQKVKMSSLKGQFQSIVTDKTLPSGLGYQGLLLNDREGKIFPQGTQVFIRASEVLVILPSKLFLRIEMPEAALHLKRFF